MKKKLLISLLCLSGAVSVFANNTNMPHAISLTGDQMASVILWKYLGQDTDKFLTSMNSNLKSYAFAYAPKLYESTNGNEIRIKRQSNKIENAFANDVNPLMNKDQLVTVQETVNIGDYDFNSRNFSFNLHKNIYLKIDGGLKALLDALDIRYDKALRVTYGNPKQQSYIPAIINMNDTEADQFISAHPDRKVCATYKIKDLHVTDPDKKSFLKNRYTLTGKFEGFSYLPGACHS